MTRKRVALFVALLALLAGSVLAASAKLAEAQPPGAPPGAAPLTSSSCTSYGYVVLMIYHSWTTPLPTSGTCWTVVKPKQDTTNYTLCDVSAASPYLQLGGSSWVYDDTNQNGHNGSTDGSLNSSVCNGHQAYWGEYEAKSGGYHWDFSPTLLFEEDYDSSHTNYGYSGATSPGSWAGTASGYNPVPTLDAAGSSVGTYIRSDCYKSPVYSGVYYISLYNGTDPGSNESAILSALNYCYS